MLSKLPSLDHLVDNYIHCLDAEGKSPKTTTWYLANLQRFSHYLKGTGFYRPVIAIGVDEARNFIYYLQTEVTRWQGHPTIRDTRTLSPFSIQGYARTIKAFWSWLLVEGYIDNNPMIRLKLPKTPHKVVATFAPEQVKRMLARLDRKKTNGFRDYVMVLVLLDTGVRLTELVGLQVDDIDFGRSCFLVHGKGGHERVVPFGREVRRVLWRYTSSVRPNSVLSGASQVFLKEDGTALRPRSLQSMLTRLGMKAGISGVRCSPHTFRHTFAKQYLMEGGDVFTLQSILGHSSLEVVKIYINLASGEIAEQHRKFSPVDNMAPSGHRKRGSWNMSSTSQAYQGHYRRWR
ncbi:tyrosine-type recombinase/integrase [Chloroflexota bacterium]